MELTTTMKWPSLYFDTISIWMSTIPVAWICSVKGWGISHQSSYNTEVRVQLSLKSNHELKTLLWNLKGSSHGGSIIIFNFGVKKWQKKFVLSFWIHILCQDLESITLWPQPCPVLQDWLCVFFWTNQILADTHKRAEALKNPRDSWLFLTIISPTLPWRYTGPSMLGNVIWPRRTELPQWLHPTPDGYNQSVHPRPQWLPH